MPRISDQFHKYFTMILQVISSIGIVAILGFFMTLGEYKKKFDDMYEKIPVIIQKVDTNEKESLSRDQRIANALAYHAKQPVIEFGK